MSYNSNTLLYLNFDQLPLTDAIGNTVNYSGTPSLDDGIFDSSYKLNKNSSISINALHSLSQIFTMCFWLKSTNPGIVTNKVINENGCSDIYHFDVNLSSCYSVFNFTVTDNNSMFVTTLHLSGSFTLTTTDNITWTNGVYTLHKVGGFWKLDFDDGDGGIAAFTSTNNDPCPPSNPAVWSKLFSNRYQITAVSFSGTNGSSITSPVDDLYTLVRTGPNTWEGKGDFRKYDAFLYLNNSQWKFKVVNGDSNTIWTNSLSSCPPISGWSNVSHYNLSVTKENALYYGSVPLVMPIISKSAFITSGHRITPSNMSWIIYEITKNNGKNQLIIILDGLDESLNSTSSILTSSEYDVGIFHHFCVQYSGVDGVFKLHLDGIEDNYTLEGEIPVSLNTNAEYIRFNYSAPGFTSQVAPNNGLIDDFVIFNETIEETTIQRLANLGVIYVANSLYSGIEEIYQTLLFDDPDTSQITSVYSSRGNLFVSKDNGQLLKGTRSLWETRKEFSNVKELENITTVDKTLDNSAEIIDGRLMLKDQIIRI